MFQLSCTGECGLAGMIKGRGAMIGATVERRPSGPGEIGKAGLPVIGVQ